MVTKFLQFVAVTAMLATLFGAVRVEAAATPTTALSTGEVLVDETGGHVFVTAGDTVAVFDLAGQRVGTIADQFGAVDLVLRGRTLYVLARNVNRINSVDADTLAVTGGWNMPGVTESWQMAWSAGAFWVTYGDQHGDGIAKLDPVTGTVTPSLGNVYAQAEIAATTSPARLYVLDGHLSPSKLRVYDVSGGTPVLLRTSPHSSANCSNGNDLALDGTGATAWTACGSPYKFHQWDTATVTAPTIVYPATPYPNAIALSGDGKILAGGTDAHYDPDIRLYDADRPTAVRVFEVGTGDLLQGMLALDHDGSRVYAVTGAGALRVFDLHPVITQQLDPVPAETETEIAVVGTELADVTAATVGTTPASVRVVSNTLAYVTVPELEGGTYPVTVTSRWGSSAPSARATVEVIANGPEATAAPTVTDTPAYGVSLEWTAPGDGGAPITSYRVRTYVGDEETPLAQETVTGTSTTIGGLVAETGYRFTVAAVNDMGVGTFSERSELALAGLPDITPFDSLTALINRQYRDVLDREPTDEERAAWIAGIRAGEVTPVDIVLALRGSEDNRTNVDAVARLYQAYFGRPADASGLSYWTNRRRGGVSLAAISDNFARSGEFRRAYARLTNRQFVELVYQRVLGRAGDASGIAFWTGQLDRGRKTRGAVMIGFSEASEYVRTTTSEVTASVVPILLLGQAPTRADYEATVDALDAGGTAAGLVEAVLASPAYGARVAAAM